MGSTFDKLRTDTGQVWDVSDDRYEALGELEDAGNLTSGTLPDARIQESGVTQHGTAALEVPWLDTVVVEGDSSTRATRATAVDSAIGEAGTDSKNFVFVPHDFLDYDASAVNFTKNGFSGRLVREGQIADVYDVKAYGAAGDDVADDSAAIQAAVDAAEARSTAIGNMGEVVWVPFGAFRYTSTLTITDTIVFVGASPHGSVLQYEGMGVGIHLDGTSSHINNWTLRDFRLDDRGGNGTIGVHIEGASEGRIVRVTITSSASAGASGWSTAGIQSESANGASISNRIFDSTVQFCSGSGIDLRGDANALVVRDSKVLDGGGDGVLIFNGSFSGIKFAGCQFERNGGASANQLRASQCSKLANLTITNCYFEHEGRAVRVDETNGTNDCEGLVLRDNYYSGISSPGAAIRLNNPNGHCSGVIDGEYIQQVLDEGVEVLSANDIVSIRSVEVFSDAGSTENTVVDDNSGAGLVIVDGVAEESANAEEPQAAWPVGTIVDFTDSGDASGDGQYVLLRDGTTWAQLA